MASITRLIFFGTPEFAVPALNALVDAGRRPSLVVTRPARRRGRGKKLADPPVAIRARDLGLPVEQPERVRAPGFLTRIAELEPDLAVVVAFGQIFPKALLEIPRLGCVNVHASLLPRWRGAAPIAAAIEAGDTETGVSIQRMEEGLDTGPVFAQRRAAIGAEETAGELSGRLSALGATLLVEVLEGLERGRLAPRPQDGARATHAPKLAGVEELDLRAPAERLARLARARDPDPGAVLRVRGERIRVHAARAAGGTVDAAPGTVLGCERDALRIAAGAGSVLELLRVRRPGGRSVTGRDLANGMRLGPGERLE